MASRFKRSVTAAERERRDQAAGDKITALHQQLAEQVAGIRSGPDWQRWLDTARRFHQYSFNNMLLIAGQRPDATAVAGYEAWKALGRQVDKGEKGIQILAPIVRRARTDRDPAAGDAAPGVSGNDTHPRTAPSGADSTGDEREAGRGHVAGFRVAYVWDLAQTSGEPLPTPPAPQLLTGQAPPGLWDALAGVISDRGFTLERGDCGTANGVTDYAARTVRVRHDVDDAQAVKTLAHEVGHVLLHDPADSTSQHNASATGVPRTLVTAGGAGTTAQCRGTKEVEAESLAYLVAATHGLPTDSYTFPYVAGWASSIDGQEPERAVRDTAQQVLAAARTVLAATIPEPATGDAVLMARAQAGADRTAAVREHATSTLSPAQPPKPTPAANPEQLDTLARLHADAAAFYTAQLHGGTPDASRAAAVLAQRVPAAAAAAYELGYAPPRWTALTNHLRSRGYNDTQLLDAGVGITTRQGSVVDRFRDRLMFPVRDTTGERVIAFLGRALTETDGTPKYLNSPETALYRKGEVLYGLGAQPSRQALAAGAQPVLVEGALDAIAVTWAGQGRYAGVAPSGTALTTPQVTALDTPPGSLARVGVVVAFDADRAGRAAALRAFDLLRTAGTWPAAATLPDGQDPAGLLQHHGPQALRSALTAAAPLADLAVDARLQPWQDHLQWAEGKLGATRDAAQLIATFPPEQVGRQVNRLARHLQAEHSAITEAVLDAVTRDRDAPGRPAHRDDRHDLNRGQTPAAHRVGPVNGAGPSDLAQLSAAQLARIDHPRPLHAAATAAAQPATKPPHQRAAHPHFAATSRRTP